MFFINKQFGLGQFLTKDFKILLEDLDLWL